MCNKAAFLTLAEAQRALRQPLRSVRAWTAKVPVRAYECSRIVPRDEASRSTRFT